MLRIDDVCGYVVAFYDGRQVARSWVPVPLALATAALGAWFEHGEQTPDLCLFRLTPDP